MKKKKDLIISLLKSKESIAELFNDNRYDNEISDIRRILNRSRDVLPKKDRKEIKDKLYKIEHQRNFSAEDWKHLRKLVRILNDKEEHSVYDCDDFDYYGIRDIENLFDEASEKNYPKGLYNHQKDLPFLSERKKVNKVEKLICCIEDKEKYIIHIKVLKQALNHGLVLKKSA